MQSAVLGAISMAGFGNKSMIEMPNQAARDIVRSSRLAEREKEENLKRMEIKIKELQQ